MALEDMSAYKGIGMLGKLMKSQRWETTPTIREDALKFVDRVISDEDANEGNRLKAVELLLKMEAQNQTDDRIVAGVKDNSDGEEKQKIVLILPPNGAERKIEAEEVFEDTEDEA
jgi:hypothetical protein